MVLGDNQDTGTLELNGLLILGWVVVEVGGSDVEDSEDEELDPDEADGADAEGSKGYRLIEERLVSLSSSVWSVWFFRCFFKRSNSSVE